MKSTPEVLAHHLRCFATRDLDGLMEDYAADAVFFTLGGMLRGREAIRGVFEKLFSEFAKPGASIASKMRLVEVEYVYSIFTAETPDNSHELLAAHIPAMSGLPDGEGSDNCCEVSIALILRWPTVKPTGCTLWVFGR